MDACGIAPLDNFIAVYQCSQMLINKVVGERGRGLFSMVLFCRATSNHKVKETVALELSYVNSNLQLLKEELEELNSSVDVYQNDR